MCSWVVHLAIRFQRARRSERKKKKKEWGRERGRERGEEGEGEDTCVHKGSQMDRPEFESQVMQLVLQTLPRYLVSESLRFHIYKLGITMPT